MEPSRPMEPPVEMVTSDEKLFTRVDRTRMMPLPSTTTSMKSFDLPRPAPAEQQDGARDETAGGGDEEASIPREAGGRALDGAVETQQDDLQMPERLAEGDRRHGAEEADDGRPEIGRVPQIDRTALGQPDAQAQKRNEEAADKAGRRAGRAWNARRGITHDARAA